MKKIKAYKVFDNNWKCKDFQFKFGETYTYEGKIQICKSGFHACLKLEDCFKFYDCVQWNKIAEVEILGDIEKHDEDSKIVTNKIKIIKEIKFSEIKDLFSK